MAIIRNTASMRLKGRVGNTTYYTEGGRQIARVSQNSSNYGDSASRSRSQQSQRGKWGNLVNFYKVSRGWMRKAYESKSAKQSDYNRFMSLNTPNAKIYLTKSMYANGGCVVDEFLISEGSIRSIVVTPTSGKYVTDLKLGLDNITANTTVGEFSISLITNNVQVKEGMQLSFISYQQEVSPFGIPQLICTAYEVTLDTTSTDILRAYLPEFCAEVSSNGYLSTSDNISVGAFAYVLSQSVGGKTIVSTQRLITNNAILIAQYSSEEAITDSINSYGVDADVFLDSGSIPVDAAAQPRYIQGIESFGGFVPTGNYVGVLQDWHNNKSLIVHMSSIGVISASAIAITTQSGSTYDVNTAGVVSGKTITFPSSIWNTLGSGNASVLESITITTNLGDITAEFSTKYPGDID